MPFKCLSRLIDKRGCLLQEPLKMTVKVRSTERKWLLPIHMTSLVQKFYIIRNMASARLILSSWGQIPAPTVPLTLYAAEFYLPCLEIPPQWPLSNFLTSIGILNWAYLSEDSQLTSTDCGGGGGAHGFCLSELHNSEWLFLAPFIYLQT